MSESRRSIRVPLQLAAALIVFSYVLFYTYKLKVSPLFAYNGLTFRSPDPSFYGAAIALTVVVALALPRTIGKVSDFVLWVLFVLGVAPSILLAQYSKTLSPPDALKMAVAITGTMLIVAFLVEHAPEIPMPFKPLEKGIDFWVMLAAFSAVIYAYLIATTGLSLQALAFVDVYDVRSEFGTASSGSLIIGYLLPVQASVVNPILIIKGLTSRRTMLLAAGVMGQLLIYTTAGQKSTLFSLLAIFGTALLFRVYKKRPAPGAAILLGVTVVSSVALLLDRVNGGILWTSLISRRVMIVPGALTAAYVKVFEDRPRANFSEIFPFVPNPYPEQRPVNIVGSLFVGNSETAANVNLFGHGYLNFGYLGMFIEGAFLVLLLVLANSATRGLPLVVSCVAFFGGALALVSASVFTTALTNGFLAAVLICSLAPRTGWLRTTVPDNDLEDVSLSSRRIGRGRTGRDTSP